MRKEGVKKEKKEEKKKKNSNTTIKTTTVTRIAVTAIEPVLPLSSGIFTG